jgi:stage II sporulation protein D
MPLLIAALFSFFGERTPRFGLLPFLRSKRHIPVHRLIEDGLSEQKPAAGGRKLMRKQLVVVLLVLSMLILLVPALLVSFGEDRQTPAEAGGVMPENQSGPMVRVWLTREKRVEEVPLETYIRGVVASEMPADFHPEALKAQALAARTYIVSRLMKGRLSDMARYGEQARGAHVTDTVAHQAYSTDKALRKIWGARYPENLSRVEKAVRETAGKIIVYDGKPIYAAFFSTSNGRTENSEDYFATRYPYLRSVESPWDRESPRYLSTVSLPLKEMIRRLERATGAKLSVRAGAGEGIVQVLDRSDGKRVSRVRIGDEIFSGRKVREALGLASSDFSLEVEGNRVKITTRGFGHGVGMSQWGAHLMALKGKRVDEIIRHYYQGVSIIDMEQVWPRAKWK